MKVENFFLEEMNERHIKQKDIAAALNLSAQTVSNKFSRNNMTVQDVTLIAALFGYNLSLTDQDGNTVYSFDLADYSDDPESIKPLEGKTVTTVAEYVSEPRPIKKIRGEKAELTQIEIPADAITYFHIWQMGKWFMIQVEGDKDRIKEAARYIRQSDKGNTEKELEDLAVTASIMFDVTVSVRKPDQHMIELLNSRGYETVEKTTDALLQD